MIDVALNTSTDTLRNSAKLDINVDDIDPSQQPKDHQVQVQLSYKAPKIIDHYFQSNQVANNKSPAGGGSPSLR